MSDPLERFSDVPGLYLGGLPPELARQDQPAPAQFARHESQLRGKEGRFALPDATTPRDPEEELPADVVSGLDDAKLEELLDHAAAEFLRRRAAQEKFLESD